MSTTNVQQSHTDQIDRLLKPFTESSNMFSVVHMQHTMLKTLNDAAMNESCTFDEDDYYHFYQLSKFLFDLEMYLLDQPNAERLVTELQKHGITTAQVDEWFAYICNKIENRKDTAPQVEFLRKLWHVLTNYKG